MRLVQIREDCKFICLHEVWMFRSNFACAWFVAVYESVKSMNYFLRLVAFEEGGLKRGIWYVRA